MKQRPLSTRSITVAVVAVLALRLAYVALFPSAPESAPVAAAKPQASQPARVVTVLKEQDPLLKAIALSDKGKLAESEKALDSIIKTKDSAAARNARGVLYYRRGDNDKALQEFDAAIKLDGKLADAYSNRATVRLAKRDKAGALADYEKVIALKPNPKEQLALAVSERDRLRKETEKKK